MRLNLRWGIVLSLLLSLTTFSACGPDGGFGFQDDALSEADYASGYFALNSKSSLPFMDFHRENLKTRLFSSDVLASKKFKGDENVESFPCPRTIGYWKNHPENWPISEISIGGIMYSKEEAIEDILKKANSKDATYMLAAQLVAAKLNVLSGSPDDEAETILAADQFLVNHPIGSDPCCEERDYALELKDILDEYNNGNAYPECGGICDPDDEVCDGKDNDCDGFVDEDLGTTTCGAGACKKTVENCVNGMPQDCVPASPSPEVCDLVDNDCNGLVDDLGTTTCGKGECEHTVDNCVNGIPQECDPFEMASDEKCGDGLDNDCDGFADEHCGSISGMIWYDANKNGVYDDFDVEWPFEGVAVKLYEDSDGNGDYETYLGETFTDWNGFYIFEDLNAGSYSIAVDDATLPPLDPLPWQGEFQKWVLLGPSNPASVAIGLSQNYTLDFRYFWAHSQLTLFKYGPGKAHPGDVISYDFVVYNCGTLYMSGGVTVYDEMLNPGGDHAIWFAANLAPGETLKFTVYYEVPSDAKGTICNEALVIGIPEFNMTPAWDTAGTCTKICKEKDFTCNGKDEDCDGMTDDDYVPSFECGTGECKAPSQCVNGVEVCTPGEPKPEVCDGKDNDCDGLVDEGLGTTTCGLGECEHTVQNCVNGEPQTCDPYEGASKEICDGLDNDCNGVVDDNCYCEQKLVIFSDPLTLYLPQGLISEEELPPEWGLPSVPTWDGNSRWIAEIPGATWIWDEYLETSPEEDQLVEFFRNFLIPADAFGFAGSITMSSDNSFEFFLNGDFVADSPIETNYFYTFTYDITDFLQNGGNQFRFKVLNWAQPGGNSYTNPGGLLYRAEISYFSLMGEEICDNLDNDCDGLTDEDLGSATCGLGACEQTVDNCVNGMPQGCVPLDPSQEVCDLVDNDCDGFADEDLGHTTCGVGECKNTVQNCVNGVPQECVPGNPSPEVCDLVDNDCDGFIDEELGSTTCGVGECKKTVENCVNGIPQECVPGLPSAEICDGKDNDCDGKIDEDCGFIGDQVWEDGNRNGVVDSGETGIDGVKVILKKGGTPVASQFTSGGGFYGFGNLLAGSFSVHVDESTLPPLPPGQKWVMPTGTNPINVSLGAGQFVYNADFGYMKAIPCLEFSKSGPFKAKKGETVTYSFTVHNCGTVWLYGGVTVYDEMLNPYGDHQIWYSHVGPGETKTFTKTYTIPGGAADPLCNLAKARGCPEFGLPFVWKESKHCIDLCSGSDETCNGADDDCDGFTDEDYKPYSCGVGECAASSLCVNGGESCTPKQPCQEVCDGKDNDCDGKTDEDLGSTTCGKGICQKTVQNCVNGVPQQCVPGESELEICDKLDNDCDGQTDEGFPAGCKNVCIVSDACVGISEGFARGWIDVSDPSADGAVVLLKNYGNKDVCMDDTIVQVSDATQSHALQPFSHTGYSPPTPGSQLKIPAGGQLYYYYASWTFANGYYHPYLAKPPWWCLEWGQLAKGPAIFFFDGETLPDTLKYYGYNSTDTNSNGKEDHVEWHGSYGTKAQYNFWNYQSLYPVLTAGKTAAAGGPGKIAVVLTVRNLGAKKGTGMLYDVVPAGFTAGGFSLSPSSVTPNPDGTKTLQWEVSVNGYLDPPGSYDTTVFYTFGILYDLYPSPETDGARVFLPKAYVKYFDCVANREAISTLPVALNVDVDGDGHPACSDCNDFNPDIYTGCP